MLTNSWLKAIPCNSITRKPWVWLPLTYLGPKTFMLRDHRPMSTHFFLFNYFTVAEFLFTVPHSLCNNLRLFYA